jgi:hypothetical protein
MASLAGCDASEDPEVSLAGPPFLIVAPAAVQPTSPEDGTTIYVQARGGTFVGITTYQGKHRYSALAGDVIESCAELPGSAPLYLLVKPDDEECLVEARLYADCDPNEGGAAMALQTCNKHGSFVESVVIPVQARLFIQPGQTPSYASSSARVDAGRDAGDAASDRGRDGPTDATPNRGDR